MDKVDLKKSHREKKISCIFFQSTHQVGMKNGVECYKDFFGYFKALKTNCVFFEINLSLEYLLIILHFDY